MTKVLTTSECLLLQHYYDGELADGEVSQVQDLLNRSQVARVFMGALEELTLATRAAEETAWDSAGPPVVAELVEHAMRAASLSVAPLSELAPLLERFFDGEAMLEEMAAVQALVDERDDVADYLANLDGLRSSLLASHEQIVDGVSFDGFWDSLESRIDAEDSVFDPEEHRVLVYRHHDGETTPAEAARVEAWLDAGNEEVAATLGVLSELRLATVAAIDIAQERADLSGLWAAVENELDDEIEAAGENVVSFAREKRERKPGIFGDSRVAAWAAVAAMLFVAFGAGLFKDQLLGPNERIIVEKTVVIVDSVEYQPGSSVMVNSPMRSVSAISAADDSATAVEEEPTVIWLLDGSDDAAPASDETVDEEQSAEDTSDQPI